MSGIDGLVPETSVGKTRALHCGEGAGQYRSKPDSFQRSRLCGENSCGGIEGDRRPTRDR